MSVHILNLYTQSPEKRQLKRHQKTGPPDVYPQDPNQEEDLMTKEKLNNGFIIKVPSCEYDSMFSVIRDPKAIEDALSRGSFFARNIIQRKSESNVFNLDRKKAKENIFIQFNTNTQQFKTFFDDLTRGRSLANLARKIPQFKHKEEFWKGLDCLYQCKVPIQKALWYLRISQVGYFIQSSPSTPAKPTKKPLSDTCATDLTRLIIRAIREMLTPILKSAQPEATPQAQRWRYFSCLFKHCFEEGILDRQEFLMELCDILNEFINFEYDKPVVFRMLITFTSNFIDYATQNIVIARRLGAIVTMRLAKYKTDYDKRMNTVSDPMYCFQQLEECQLHRATILTMMGILHSLVIDCSAAFVHNGVESPDRSNSTQQLCGSPLDFFPYPMEVTYRHFAPNSQKMVQILKMRFQEIKERSTNVDSKWAQIANRQSGFEQSVDSCLDVLSALDMMEVSEPKALLILYREVFMNRMKDAADMQKEILIRLRMCVQWAISTEREGSHRALVIAELIHKRIQLSAAEKKDPFAGFRIQDILTDFVMSESPRADSTNYRREYANLIHLYVELQRFGVFSHDDYYQSLLRAGILDSQVSIMQRLGKASQSNGSQKDDDDVKTESPMKNPPSIPQSSQHDPALISFIPMTIDNSPLPTLERPKEMEQSPIKSQKDGRASAADGSFDNRGNEEVWLLEEGHTHLCGEHPFLDPSTDDLSVHDRFLIHLPIEQKEPNRNACNQRDFVMHGLSAQRDDAKNILKRAAAEICKIWRKRINVQFFPNSKEVCFKRRMDQIPTILTTFHQQTYYDQWLIVGWCADDFMGMIYDFLGKDDQNTLPTMESLDILCGMMEECCHIHGIVELAMEMLPLIAELELQLSNFNSDCVPGAIGGQLAYVLCSYLGSHIDYLLLCDEAPEILNCLMEYFQYPLCAVGYPRTGWSRAVCMFMWALRTKLQSSGLHNDKPLPGNPQLFSSYYPRPGAKALADNLKFNRVFFTDLINAEPRRFFCYHTYKTHLPSIEDDHTKFSFVVNVFKVVLECGKDFEKLAELANICSHISAQKNLSTEWVMAIVEMCLPAAPRRQFLNASGVEIGNLRNHYALSTFVLLLASKYSFSVPALITRLNQLLFNPVIDKGDSVGYLNSPLAEAGLCLALRICTGIVCARDEPYHIRAEEQSARPRKPFGYSADLRALRSIQIWELDNYIFPLLGTVCVLNDTVRRRSTNDSVLLSYTKCSLLAMAEEEWVVRRVFYICENNEFDTLRSKKLVNSSLGQQLLQIVLRRRSERRTKTELLVCNGNSKRSLLEKLFTTLNLWNFRATYFDLVLMVKEISPDQRNNNTQYAVIADALLGEIAKCCRDLFLRAKTTPELLDLPAIATLRPSDINFYWLVAPLIGHCPKPEYVPTTLKGKFLKEFASMLDKTKGEFDRLLEAKPKELQKIALNDNTWLLGQQSFVNLILACADDPEDVSILLQAILQHFNEVIARVRETPTLPFQHIFGLARTGLMLRLGVVGRLFDGIGQQVEQCVLALFQLLYYGVISPDRDREYFDACFDMLSMMVHKYMIPTSSSTDMSKSEAARSRFSQYYNLMRKIRKELGDRTIPVDIHCLTQLLPIPRTSTDYSSWESFTAQSPAKSRNAQSNALVVAQRGPPLTAIRLDKFPTFAQKSIIRLLQHTHFLDFPSPGIWGIPHPKDLFLQAPEMEMDRQMPQQPQQPALLMSSAQQQQQQQQQQRMYSQQQPQMPQHSMMPNAPMGADRQMNPNAMMGGPMGGVPTSSQSQQPPTGPYMGNTPMPSNVPMGAPGTEFATRPMGAPPNAQQMRMMQQRQSIHQQQQQQPPQQPLPPPPGPISGGRGGRRKSTTGGTASQTARGAKRKKETKMDVKPPPMTSQMGFPQPGAPMEAQMHPSTANFPHAPPSQYQQQHLMHSGAPQHSQPPGNYQQWQQQPAPPPQPMRAPPQQQMPPPAGRMGPSHPQAAPPQQQTTPDAKGENQRRHAAVMEKLIQNVQSHKMRKNN